MLMRRLMLMRHAAYDIDATSLITHTLRLFRHAAHMPYIALSLLLIAADDAMEMPRRYAAAFA